MKIAIVGSREFKFSGLIKEVMERTFSKRYNDILVSGGARGVDSIAENLINEWNNMAYAYSKTPYQFKKIILKPDWDNLSHLDAIIKINKFGKKYDARAGMRRNKLIIDEADRVLAFWDGKSSGTKNSVDLAIKANKPIDIYVRS